MPKLDFVTGEFIEILRFKEVDKIKLEVFSPILKKSVASLTLFWLLFVCLFVVFLLPATDLNF